MKFDQVTEFVRGVPFITELNARYLYDLILREKLASVLELGIAHGTATCYLAAAIDELGQGSVTAVDLVEAKSIFNPSAEDQLEKTGLSKHVQLHRMQTGYNWFLHDEIKRCTKDNVCQPFYDLCIIDGPKNWTIDGAAFFMVDKLLKKDGWIIFDDYNWSYSQSSHNRESTDGITHRSLSKDEQEMPQIKEVFELLVKQHPNYGNLMLWDDEEWALAQKTMDTEKTYTIVTRKNLLTMIARKAYRTLKG